MSKIFALAAAALFLAAVPAGAEGTLTIFIWSEYIDPAVVEGFEKEFGLKVKFDYYESNEEMIAKLRSGGARQYDLIVPSTYFMPSLRKLDLIQPLDHGQLTNLGNLDPEFANLEVDPGCRFSVAYQWGTSGLAVRGDQAKKKDSWGLLFDPGETGGGVIIFDTARDALGSALKYMGYSLNSTDPGQIEKAMNLLIAVKARPNFFSFDGGVGGLNKTVGGLAAIAQVYSGDAVRAQEEEGDINYILPEEGFEIWTDLMAIPAQAPNPEGAHAFIDYLLRPEVGAKLATYNRYATPNVAARAFIPPEDLANPALYPPPELMRKAEYMKDLGPDNRLYDEAWTVVKSK